MPGLKDLELTSPAYLKCALCKIHIKSVMNFLSRWVVWGGGGGEINKVIQGKL